MEINNFYTMLKSIVLLFAISVIGCLPPHYSNSGPDVTDDDLSKVQIFFKAPPDTQYTIIGTIAGSDEDYDDLIEDLQERTLKMGGNAFIVINQNSNYESSAMVGGVSGGAVIGASSDNDKINYLVRVIKLFK